MHSWLKFLTCSENHKNLSLKFSNNRGSINASPRECGLLYLRLCDVKVIFEHSNRFQANCMTTRWRHLWQENVPGFSSSLSSSSARHCSSDPVCFQASARLRPSLPEHTEYVYALTPSTSCPVKSNVLIGELSTLFSTSTTRVQLQIFFRKRVFCLWATCPLSAFDFIKPKILQLIEYLFQFFPIREKNELEKHPNFTVLLEVRVTLPSRKHHKFSIISSLQSNCPRRPLISTS